MFYKIIKTTIPILLSVFLFSCGKSGMKADHSCCKKGNTPKATTAKVTTGSSNNSLYQLTGKWANQNDSEIELNQLKGKIRLVAMIFTHCSYACPKMVSNIQAIEKTLPADLKNKVGYVLVTFDPENDTPARLEQYAKQKQLDSQWTLLHGDKSQVRILSMLLQVQYDELPNGNFNHSNILTVLDDKGAIAKQFEGLDINTANVIETIGKLAAK